MPSKGAIKEHKEHPWTTMAQAERIDKEHKRLEKKHREKVQFPTHFTHGFSKELVEYAKRF